MFTVSHLHQHLSIPVIAKLRVFPSLSRTLDYATHVYHSGAQLLTIHGRVREAKGRLAGFASWSKIAAVTTLLQSKVPILANGGVPSAREVQPCLDATGSDGIMSAEGNLYNPMIFRPANPAGCREYLRCLPIEMRDALLRCDDQFLPLERSEWDNDAAHYAPSTWLAAQYLAIVRTLPSTRTAPSAIKAHLFKLFRPTWAAGRHLEMREMLGKAGSAKNLNAGDKVQAYEDFVEAMLQRYKVSRT